MIFLSYSWRQAEHALRLAQFLRESNIPYWFDRDHLDLSTDLHHNIACAVADADLIAHLDSKESRSSPWVSFELRTAQALGKKLQPVSPSFAAEAHNKALLINALPAMDRSRHKLTSLNEQSKRAAGRA